MARTCQEWYDWCMERGTRGDQVFSILCDWKAEKAKLDEQDNNSRIALTEIDSYNPIRNDKDAYLNLLAEWGLGNTDDKPNPQDFGLLPLKPI